MMLNVTDATNKIMTSDKYSVQVNITNNGSTPYHEDISLKM
jgi:archaellum component FlaF (FlaF/FlaG flagellin family)